MTALRKHSTLLIVGAIAILGIIAYINALPNKMFYDDDQGIVNNAYIKDWQNFPKFFSQDLTAGSGFPSNYWRPMLLITYSIEWHIWGNWAPGFHAVNILFHIANAILIFLILYYLFSARAPAAIAALIFTIHPLQTESITYVSGLGDPLSLFFMLLATYWFIRVRYNEPTMSRRSFWLNYSAIFVSFILALITKDRSIIFPGIILLTDVIIWKVRESLSVPFWTFVKRSAVRFAPFALLSVGYFALRNTVLLNIQNSPSSYEVPASYAAHIIERIITFLQVVPTYFSLIFVPIGLHMERSEEVGVVNTFLNPSVLIGAGIILALGLIAFYTWKKHPAYTFGFLWSAIMMFPASGIVVPVAGILYEHYLYAPLAGIAFIIGLAGYDIYEKMKSRSARISLASAGAIAVVLLTGQTIHQNNYWKDPITFYTETLKYVPHDSRMFNNLGLSYENDGDFKDAE